MVEYKLKSPLDLTPIYKKGDDIKLTDPGNGLVTQHLKSFNVELRGPSNNDDNNDDNLKLSIGLGYWRIYHKETSSYYKSQKVVKREAPSDGFVMKMYQGDLLKYAYKVFSPTFNALNKSRSSMARRAAKSDNSNDVKVNNNNPTTKHKHRTSTCDKDPSKLLQNLHPSHFDLLKRIAELNVSGQINTDYKIKVKAKHEDPIKAFAYRLIEIDTRQFIEAYNQDKNYDCGALFVKSITEVCKQNLSRWLNYCLPILNPEVIDDQVFDQPVKLTDFLQECYNSTGNPAYTRALKLINKSLNNRLKLIQESKCKDYTVDNISSFCVSYRDKNMDKDSPIADCPRPWMFKNLWIRSWRNSDLNYFDDLFGHHTGKRHKYKKGLPPNKAYKFGWYKFRQPDDENEEDLYRYPTEWLVRYQVQEFNDVDIYDKFDNVTNDNNSEDYNYNYDYDYDYDYDFKEWFNYYTRPPVERFVYNADDFPPL